MKALILKNKDDLDCVGVNELCVLAKQFEKKLNIPVIPLINELELKCIDSDNLDVYIKELENLKINKESLEEI